MIQYSGYIFDYQNITDWEIPSYYLCFEVNREEEPDSQIEVVAKAASFYRLRTGAL